MHKPASTGHMGDVADQQDNRPSLVIDYLSRPSLVIDYLSLEPTRRCTSHWLESQRVDNIRDAAHHTMTENAHFNILTYFWNMFDFSGSILTLYAWFQRVSVCLCLCVYLSEWWPIVLWGCVSIYVMSGLFLVFMDLYLEVIDLFPKPTVCWTVFNPGGHWHINSLLTRAFNLRYRTNQTLLKEVTDRNQEEIFFCRRHRDNWMRGQSTKGKIQSK